MAVLKLKQGGIWYKIVAGKWTPELFSVQEGKPCVSISTEVVGGARWQQKELSLPMDEPYLKEWGWQRCVAEGMDSMELYRWLYRCAKEGFTVDYRTIMMDGVEQEPVAVDGGTDLAFAIARAYGDTSAGSVEWFGKQYPSDPENFRVMNIPLMQFEGLSEETLLNVIYRVKEDNPELCFLLFPSYSQALPVLEENGSYKTLYCIAPTGKKRKEMVDVMRKARAYVHDKVYHLYGIEAGKPLSVEQKKKVLKIIHDWMILHGWSSETESNGSGLEVNYLSNTAYAALDPGRIALCGGYTQAFNYMARSFSIHAIYMSGYAYRNASQIDGDGHTWCAVQMSDSYEYGTYSQEPQDWSCIDVYWDEPAHEAAYGGAAPVRDDVIWRYFLDVDTIFQSYPRHEIDSSKGYGTLPCGDAEPTANYKYEGNSLYRWEELE